MTLIPTIQKTLVVSTKKRTCPRKKYWVIRRTKYVLTRLFPHKSSNSNASKKNPITIYIFSYYHINNVTINILNVCNTSHSLFSSIFIFWYVALSNNTILQMLLWQHVSADYYQKDPFLAAFSFLLSLLRRRWSGRRPYYTLLVFRVFHIAKSFMIHPLIL